MKNILYILIFFTITAKSQTTFLGRVAYSPNPLIIIAGESNAGGLALNTELSASEAAIRPFIKILNNENLTFESLHIGGNNMMLHAGLPGGVTHGIENGLANSADSGTFGGLIPVYILKAGIGLSQIHWWNDSTYLYYDLNAWEQLKMRLDTAIKLLRPLNSGAPPKLYFFWTQGINDSLNSIPSAAWKDSTKVFFVKLRQRYGNIPIFMTYLTPDYTSYNARVTELAAEVDNFYAIQTDDADLEDVNHWDYTGWKLIATRFIYTLLAHYRFRY